MSQCQGFEPIAPGDHGMCACTKQCSRSQAIHHNRQLPSEAFCLTRKACFWAVHGDRSLTRIRCKLSKILSTSMLVDWGTGDAVAAGNKDSEEDLKHIVHACLSSTCTFQAEVCNRHDHTVHNNPPHICISHSASLRITRQRAWLTQVISYQ